MNPANSKRTFERRLGDRLRSLRLQKQMTQHQLAAKAGIDRSFLSDVERGKKNIGSSYLNTLAQTYGMTLSSLLEGL